MTGTVIPAFDMNVAEACAAHSPDHPVLRAAMLVATTSGGIRANFIIAVGGSFWMWRHHRRRFAIAWLIIALVGGLIVLQLKSEFDRDRPPLELRDPAVHQNNASYPSGHAMGSLVGYGMLGFVLVHRVKGWRRRFAINAALAGWVVAIGFSRVYLRAHWASDIVGGWLIGLAYVNMCLAVCFRRRVEPS